MLGLAICVSPPLSFILYVFLFLVAAVRRCTGFRHVTTELVLVAKYSLPRLHRSPHYRANQRNLIADHRRLLADPLDSCYSRLSERLCVLSYSLSRQAIGTPEPTK